MLLYLNLLLYCQSYAIILIVSLSDERLNHYRIIHLLFNLLFPTFHCTVIICILKHKKVIKLLLTVFKYITFHTNL